MGYMFQVDNEFMAKAGNRTGNELVREILKVQVNGKRVSKYRLAKDLGVSDTCVDKWVDDESAPLPDNFNKLQDYLTYVQRLSKIQSPFRR